MYYDELFMESVSLSPIPDLFDPMIYFREYVDSDPVQEYLTEASGDPPTKKNIFRKLWDMIVAAIGKIIKGFQGIIKWCKNKIFGKKDKKPRTADQILNDLGLKRSESGDADGQMVPWDTENSDGHIDQNIKTMMSPMMMEFEADHEIIKITPLKYMKEAIKGLISDNKTSVSNLHKSKHDPRGFMIAMKFISRPEAMDEIELIATHIASGQLSVNDRDRIDKLFSSSILHPNINFTYKVTVKQISEFNAKLLKIQKILQTSDDTRNSVGDDSKEAVDAMNKLFMALLNLQAGSTFLGTALSRTYIIHPDYTETINSVEILDKFVHEMLEAGFPDKYIAFNAWMACTKEIKGNADADKPCQGMSRLVFLPENPKDVVYKIAINGWGIRSNNSEKEISDAVNAAGVGENFAKILYIGPNKCVITMERADNDRTRTKKYVPQVQKAMDAAIAKAGLPGKCGDVNYKNIGFLGDRIVSIDYGMLKRTAKTS